MYRTNRIPSTPTLFVLLLGPAIAAGGLSHCIKVRLESGEYRCNPTEGLACPENWECLYNASLDQHRCYALPLDCTDQDGDRYGDRCPSPDCDDTRAQVGACRTDGCPDGWALVEAGPFQMGCDPSDPCWADRADESPRHGVNLSAFCIQKTEVTVADYRACLQAGACTGAPTPSSDTANAYGNWTPDPSTRERHPLNHVTWFEARQYCRDWLDGDLPNEAQWEKAARSADQRTFPWGNEPADCDRCNFDSDQAGEPWGCLDAFWGPATWPVGPLYGPEGTSPYGAEDMAGNVAEWVVDCYDATGYETCEGCTDPVNDCETGHRVVRGGSLFQGEWGMRTVARDHYEETHRSVGVGFRCVRQPVP